MADAAVSEATRRSVALLIGNVTGALLVAGFLVTPWFIAIAVAFGLGGLIESIVRMDG